MAPPLPPLPVDPFWFVWLGFLLAGTLISAKRPGNRVGLTVVDDSMQPEHMSAWLRDRPVS